MDEGRRPRLKRPLTLSVRQCDSKELLLRPIVEISRLVSYPDFGDFSGLHEYY
jgi:hypothetical protein